MDFMYICSVIETRFWSMKTYIFSVIMLLLPLTADAQKVYDEIHEIKWYLGYIKTTTDQIFESFPSYIYKQPNEYDGKICDDANYCQRYIFLDDEPYNDSTPNS